MQKLSCLLIGILFSSVIFLVVGAQTIPVVTPDAITETLANGACADESIHIQTGAVPIAQLDVAVVMDVTGSMRDEIAAVTREASQMVRKVRELVPDTRFAVATFADYPQVRGAGGLLDLLGGLVEFGDSGDYPWRLDQDFTLDVSQVQAAFNGIQLVSGGDDPESYLRALDEAGNLDWRPDARRIVVLFGDSYPHDPDPGDDAEMGTADDLTFDAVIHELTQTGIGVISIYARSADAEFYRHTASETGGQWFELEDASQAPAALVDLVKEEVSLLRRVTLQPDREYQDWVTWMPAEIDTIGPEKNVEFQVQLCRPEDAPAGDHHFNIQVTASDSRLSTIPVTVHGVPVIGFPWWIPALLIIPLLIGLGILLLRRKQRRLPPRKRPKPAPKAPRSDSGSGSILEPRRPAGGKSIRPDR